MSIEARQKETKRKKKDIQQQRLDDLLSVLSTPAGRRFVWRLLDETSNLHGGSFVQDSHVTAYGEGRRAVGIALMQECQRLAPKQYVQMMDEQLRVLGATVGQAMLEDSEKEDS